MEFRLGLCCHAIELNVLLKLRIWNVARVVSGRHAGVAWRHKVLFWIGFRTKRANKLEIYRAGSYWLNLRAYREPLLRWTMELPVTYFHLRSGVLRPASLARNIFSFHENWTFSRLMPSLWLNGSDEPLRYTPCNQNLILRALPNSAKSDRRR